MSDQVGAIHELPHDRVSEKETIVIVPNTPPHIPVSSLWEKNYDLISLQAF